MILIVSVSADLPYGPIYNRGIAQVMYESLINHRYIPRSSIPVTLIGFSGGGQIAMGWAAFLKEALDAPIDIISLGGFFGGRNPILRLWHATASETARVQLTLALLITALKILIKLYMLRCVRCNAGPRMFPDCSNG
ncbi:hypothetical protein MiSe_03850 [Microseira wollei NIES-4236]|uniref:Phospholipase/carboxylesterase n=1 Tax=Microseira wollei NIES-4236 TaxID=2530354 RepID=A0AAV3X165_9CYAN|nr:hypothetical protein MiSe_03850 [Microseira wollei NIES-4236]